MNSLPSPNLLKRKAIGDTNDDSALLCYCGLYRIDQFMFVCKQCRRNVHIGCLKTERPSPLLGDVYFKFICEICSPDFVESFERINLPWIYVLIISLYNLHVQSSSNCGYFKWRTHICAFIEKHWASFFGPLRKKSSTWPGTVAGTLSANSPQHFKSGTPELGEPGWWALTSRTLPTVDELLATTSRKCRPGRSRMGNPNLALPENVGLRNRSTKSSIQAAIELKEKRSQLTEAKQMRQNMTFSALDRTIASEEFPVPSTSVPTPEALNPKIEHWEHPYLLDNVKQEEIDVQEPITVSKHFWNTELSGTEVLLPDMAINEETLPGANDLPSILMAENIKKEPSDWQHEIFGDAKSEDFFLDEQAIALNIDIKTDSFNIPQSQSLEIGDLMVFNSMGDEIMPSNENSDESECECSDNTENDPTAEKPAKKRKGKQDIVERNKYILMTEYDEHQLLKKLEKMAKAVDSDFTAKRLRRKLLYRQEQRERCRPLFDLDENYRKLSGIQENIFPSRKDHSGGVLDRFQLVCESAQGRTHHNFVTRLMGFEDDQQDSIISPYTMRTLKPFIFRDYDSCPLKMKLLLEIQHFYEGKDPNWEQPKRFPLDFCYVRPNHIPVINSLCQVFFWPGIDLSECLQYPDFSCVVLYRKVIVGFAFMVPDVKYNEVYISFIFTHPEWRNAGIATFMIYHLIQTCMGKDVTLHVSVSNPAVFLYQKFGFKVEELILNFYDKYHPVKSKECRHALFLRLSR